MATELHLSATQKFLLEVTGLSARNVDHGVCVTKLRAIDRCRDLEFPFVAVKKNRLFSVF